MGNISDMDFDGARGVTPDELAAILIELGRLRAFHAVVADEIEIFERQPAAMAGLYPKTSAAITRVVDAFRVVK